MTFNAPNVKFLNCFDCFTPDLLKIKQDMAIKVTKYNNGLYLCPIKKKH